MAFTKVTLTGTRDTIKAAWTKFNSLIDDLLATTSGKGASQIGIEDAASNMAAANVEDALTEIYADVVNPRTAWDTLDENSATTTGTTWGFKGGLVRFDNTVRTITAATVALTDDAVNYVEIDRAGTVSRNTTGFTASEIPIRQITVASGTQTVSTDKRAWFNQGLLLIDADGDTSIEVERTADCDTAHFKVAGGDQLLLTDGALTPNADDDIVLGTTAKAFKEINLVVDGLRIQCATDASHDFIISPGSNLTADRTLTITTGDANRTLTLNENLTIGDGTNITITGVTAARTLTMNENLTIGDGSDVTITAEDAAGAITLDNCGLEVKDNFGSGNTILFQIGTDDASRTVTLSENLTVGNGYDIQLIAQDAAGTLTLDNCDLEAEDTIGSGNTIKHRIGTDDASRTITWAEDFNIGDGYAGTLTFTGASKTLSVEDDTVVNQDLTTDANVTHAQLQLTAQPAFLVHPTSSQSNIATGSDVTIVFGTEVFDLGGDFAANNFTAPVTGKYRLDVFLRLDDVDSATNYTIQLVTSNRTYAAFYNANNEIAGDGNITFNCFSLLIDMDVNDNAYVTLNQAAGTAQTDVLTSSYFSGNLVA